MQFPMSPGKIVISTMLRSPVTICSDSQLLSSVSKYNKTGLSKEFYYDNTQMQYIEDIQFFC